ncbi:MAG: RIP metalloprotease RseP [Flavobacteriia bacterium]|nr:RIP metalloprotease RseP [Flavobacteriia bacterium]
MDILIKAAQLILSLSILVLLHEFGHYIPAKLFKTRIEKFYLFFDPWFSIFKKKVGDTEWGIGWLPLGGYVKISGMVDESMDKEQLAQPAQPWEFRSKPAWQRLIIMIGGVTVNLILGVLIYICVVFGYGEEKLNPSDLKAGLAVHPYMQKFGLESGDNILAINGEKLENILESNTIILLRNGRKLEVVKANGTKKTIVLPKGIDHELFQEGAMSAFGPRLFGVKIGEIEKNSPAAKVKLQKEDKIIKANGTKIVYFDDFQKILYNSKGKKIDLEIKRNGKIFETKVFIPKSGTFDGRLGFANNSKTIVDNKKFKHFNYSFGESISRGIIKGKNTLSDYVSQFKFVFTKKGAGSVGGFAAIGNMFPAEWDWEIFWLNTAFISIVLAFMNILPIPALDGGHVVFLIYEMVTGKEAPQKVLEYAQIVGFVFLMGLLLYANGNDIYKWLSH